MMEFVACAKTGVHVYNYAPGSELSDEPAISFPPVPNADGCAWSNDGNLLGIANSETKGVSILLAADNYAPVSQVLPLCGGPIRMFYFSPLGNFVVTYERYSKETGDNVGLFDTRTGELKWSFILKKLTEMNWPPLKWTSEETHCCRMVQDAISIMPGNCQRDEGVERLEAKGVVAFEVAPRGAGGAAPCVSIVIGESKGAPARCQVYRIDNLSRATAQKSFYKVQTVKMCWNNTGSAVLVLTSMEVDDTGKNYYGNTNLYFMRDDGSEDSIVASAGDGPVHDVQWSPVQDEFLLLHGDLPCGISLHEGKKGSKRMEFGKGHRNTIRWNTFGRFFMVGGFGQLLGDTDFWDKPGKQPLGSTRMECCVVSSFGPDGRSFLTATTAPRMRVDNKIQLFDYVGNNLHTLPFEELYMASWRPRPRGGAFQDRPPSPGREKSASASLPKAAGGYPAAKSAAKAAAKPKAYVPPGARGAGGGLAAQLRAELGSTSTNQPATASKVFGGGPLPPGAAPDSAPQGGGSGASRNARKKKAKEAAEAAGKDEAATSKAPAPKAAPAAPKAADPAPAAAPEAEPEASGPAELNPEAEKKVRALKKKLRDIEKLKDKPAAELDVLQRQKLDGEAEIIAQIRSLGGEP